MSYVRRYLETFHPVTDEQYAQIAPYEKEILTLKKGEYFLKAGEVTGPTLAIAIGTFLPRRRL